jgi:hypothetical protein
MSVELRSILPGGITATCPEIMQAKEFHDMFNIFTEPSNLSVGVITGSVMRQLL